MDGFVELFEVEEVCGEEDVKVALKDEVGGDGDHGAVVARLDYGGVCAGERVGERVEVGHDEPMARKVGVQLLHQPQRVGRDKRRLAQIRKQGRMLGQATAQPVRKKAQR